MVSDTIAIVNIMSSTSANTESELSLKIQMSLNKKEYILKATMCKLVDGKEKYFKPKKIGTRGEKRKWKMGIVI
jgi:hypothetical protein